MVTSIHCVKVTRDASTNDNTRFIPWGRVARWSYDSVEGFIQMDWMMDDEDGNVVV